jgi:hypothetical protein
MPTATCSGNSRLVSERGGEVGASTLIGVPRHLPWPRSPVALPGTERREPLAKERPGTVQQRTLVLPRDAEVSGDLDRAPALHVPEGHDHSPPVRQFLQRLSQLGFRR